ncbi:beta-lactamase-like protein [Whalleya microplaca]|nr:beta-lactamase-like protein [Whalleya microplaca]
MADTKAPVFVVVSALDAGHITLLDNLFVTDADPEERTTVPSLSFLIQHSSPSPARDSGVTNLIFDLGVKRDLNRYTPEQQVHVAQRQPIITDPDCAASLRTGCSIRSTEKVGEDAALLDPEKDIDVVILSHVHWDHIGTPSDFSGATFAVGSGTLDLLRHGAGPLYPAELFNDDELPALRTIEFPPVFSRGGDGDEYYTAPRVPKHTPVPQDTCARLPTSAEVWSWQPLAGFPHALDFFGDGSLFVIDSPGHLYGHVNLLARTGENTYIYLGGDCCHNPKILSGEKEIALYDDGRGGLRSVHVDTRMARKTIDRIGKNVREMRKGAEVEVILAHDKEWRELNRHRFWPGKL